MSSSPIFIGGTGRSGTTILYRLLQANSAVFGFNHEMRFIVDYHGVINLVDALTRNYSTTQAREALYHFEVFMAKWLGPGRGPPYAGLNLEKFFGPDYYRERLQEFMDGLVDSEFRGTDYPVTGGCLRQAFNPVIQFAERRYNRIRKQIVRRPGYVYFWPRRVLKNVRYFPDRAALCRYTATFIDDLFMHAARRHGKSVWCEKTPSNLLHFDFLLELYPAAKFINVVRDPRAVAFSMMGQMWASSTLEDTCAVIRHNYRKWFDLKAESGLSIANLIELRLEDIAADYSHAVRRLCEFCEIPNRFSSSPRFDSSRVNAWRDRIGSTEWQLASTLLQDEIRALGYTL